MGKVEIKCPACTKTVSRRQDALSHFTKALEGWDVTWDVNMPHVVWATQQGIELGEGGIMAEKERPNLKRVLYAWYENDTREQLQSSSGAIAHSEQVFTERDTW